MELWLHGQTQISSVVERIESVGEKLIISSLNQSVQSVDSTSKMINLPDFAFNDSEVEKWGLFYGYEAIDPTGQLILYSAKANNSDGFEIRLLDLHSGNILWRHPSKYLSSSMPQWTQDGNYVLFDVSIPASDNGDNWWKIISLGRDGQASELPPQPFPFIENGELVQYSQSPDRRYIYYVAWDVDIDNWSSQTRAFIVDSMTGAIGEICDPDAKFIAAVPTQGNVEGQWLPDGQFVYRTVMEKEGVLTHSLRILDIPSWTVQVLFEPEKGQGVNIYGWTPIEFP